MQDYIDPYWQPILAANNLGSFEKLWETDAELVEPLNRRGGGWSGVWRLNLRMPEGGETTIFLKRQQNHVYKPITNIVRGVPTFRREMKNMRRFMQLQLPIAEPMYYQETKHDGYMRAILITASISPAYRALEDWFKEWSATGLPPLAERHKISAAIADTIRQMHDFSLKHGALMTKHIFVRYVPGEPVGVKFIDLEKARYWPFLRGGPVHDLTELVRTLPPLSRSEKLFFYKEYMHAENLQPQDRRLLQEVEKRLAHIARKKQRKKKHG